MDAHGRVRLTLAGDLDLATVHQFRSSITDVLHHPGVTGVDLDLGRLDFVDSLGVDALVTGMRMADQRRIGYQVVSVGSGVHKLFEFLGLDRLITPDATGP